FGTPRVPPSAVREHLLRTSRYSAAKLTLQQAGWSLDDDGGWYGRKDNGRKCVVCTPRYRDPDWHRACCALVRSELLQSVGRGRAILPEGIPVFVVTRENLGDPTIRIASAPFAPLSTLQARALAAAGADTHSAQSVTRIAEALDTSRQWTYQVLHQLEEDGRVGRVGDKGGWYQR